MSHEPNPSKKESSSLISSTIKELGSPKLPANVQSELEQVVDNIFQIQDKEEQRKELIVNIIQLVVSYGQSELSNYPFPPPEILEKYKFIDESLFGKIISLTEKTIEHDLQIEESESTAQIGLEKQKQAAEIELESKRLNAEIRSRDRGQIFAFIFAIITLVIAGYAVSVGSPIAGSIFSVLSVATTIAAFLKLPKK